MKKLILIVLFFCAALSALGSSFLVSKRSAEKVRESYTGEVSQLKGSLIIFSGAAVHPCWLFKGEYANVMTGATFDVYVSLLGNIQKAPK